MIFQIQSSSDFAKGNHPYAFSPLPQNAPEEYPSPSSSADDSLDEEETGCGSEEVGVGIRLVILILILVFVPATINFGSSFRILPELEINSFSISNLTISTSNVEAVWDSYIIFEQFKRNPAVAEVLFYDQIEAYIYYKNTGNQIAAVKGEAFSVKSNESRRVHLRLSRTGLKDDQGGLEDLVVKEIKKEVENGVMHFSLRVDLGVSFERWRIRWSGNHVRYSLDSYCWDLMAGIDSKLGKGRLISAQGAPCHG